MYSALNIRYVLILDVSYYSIMTLLNLSIDTIAPKLFTTVPTIYFYVLVLGNKKFYEIL